jgi:hypothetical protein
MFAPEEIRHVARAEDKKRPGQCRTVARSIELDARAAQQKTSCGDASIAYH